MKTAKCEWAVVKVPHPNGDGYRIEDDEGDIVLTRITDCELALALCREHNAHDRLLVELSDAAASLDLIAEQCDRWAHESETGGWSTHQVEAQWNKANLMRKQAAHVRIALATGKDATP